MENIYNIVEKKVMLERWEMPRELEMLAAKLVNSGRFRIDADDMCNFVRFAVPSDYINLIFSYRELCDPELIPRTADIVRKVLSMHLKGAALDKKVTSEMERLRHNVTKILGVDAQTEMRLARAIVQATHPVVMLLLLAEGAELFISYSHTVGDMLDIQSWQSAGSSSGLQSTGHMESAVFVSCGGHPFLPEDKKRHDGEGLDALARMVVIGGQELGHFSDIIRDKRGRKTSRYSANLSATRAKKEVREARLNDIKNVESIQKKLAQIGALDLAELERHLKFFRKQSRRGLVVLNTIRRINNKTRRLISKLKRAKMAALIEVPPYEEEYIASKIVAMAIDMRFNLSPKADAYAREDPVEEEAIACVEALARVPQQANKWGHRLTRAMMPNLYRIYYKEVIPGCIEAFENLTGEKYRFTITQKGWFARRYEKMFYKGV